MQFSSYKFCILSFYFKTFLHIMKIPDQASLYSNMLPLSLWFSSQTWKLNLFLALIIYVILHCVKLRKQKKLLFQSWPVVGMLPLFILALKTGVHELTTHMLRSHNGTFIFKGPWLTGFDHVLTSDPCNLRYILQTNFKNFRKGESTLTIMHDFLGESFFNTDGKIWSLQRKLVNVKLHINEFNKTAMESWDELIHSRLLPVLEDFIKQSVVFDLQDVLIRLSFDQNCFTALGVDPGYLAHGLPNSEIALAFKKVEEVTALRFYLPMFIWKTMRYLNVGWEREMKTSIEQMNKFAGDVITARKKQLSEKYSAKKPRYDFLSLFIESKDEDGSSFPDHFLRDICYNLMFAGTDTTPVGLSWFFWLLDQNPNVEQQIYAEVCHLLGKKTSSEEDTHATFRPEDVKKMHYLHAALTEALRLYPPVPLNRLEVHDDDQFPNGVMLKKGNKVVYSMYAMGRMDSIWGEDCNEFKPERWMRDGEFVAESPYKFSAFNAGVRICLGKDLVFHLMKVVAASIIFQYRVHVVENHAVEPKLSPMLHMKHGLKVTLGRRDESESTC